MVPCIRHFRFFAFVCLVALLGAQVFGVARGYLCDCTGLMEWTVQDHCHGPHSEDCHQNEPPGHDHDEDSGSHDRRDHRQVRDDIASPLGKQSAVAPSLVPVVISVFEARARWIAPVVPRAAWSEVPADTGPPLGVAVARTTVLLI